jgi:hypothetical protein
LCPTSDIGDIIDVSSTEPRFSDPPGGRKVTTHGAKEVKRFVLRLPEDEHEGLKIMANVTGKSMNDLVVRAVQEFLAGSGRREEFEAILAKVSDRHRLVLDKLADS